MTSETTSPTVDANDTICTIDPGSQYEALLALATVTGAGFGAGPTFLTTYVSDPVEYDGTLAAPTSPTLMADADPLEQSGTQEFNIQAFASAVDSAGYRFLIQDFEDDSAGTEDYSSGNFAGSAALTSYTAATGTTHDSATGTMADGTADGVLIVDGLMSVELFNTGNNTGNTPAQWGDDPGIATNPGNDADRGYNKTSGGDQYLEVLPANTDNGGVVLCFDEGTTVYGFSFYLMGREATKRDVYLDIHFSDGSVHRTLTDTNALNTGGEQFYSYLVDPTESSGESILAVVLYEPYDSENDDAGARDIFAIDDLALVVDPQAVSGYDLIDGDAYETRMGLGGTMPPPPGGIVGTEGDDTLDGTEGDDMIEGLAGDDTLNGGLGNDTLSDVQGRNVLDGGGDIDVMDLSMTDAGTWVHMASGLAKSAEFRNLFSNIEEVRGGTGRDVMVGDDETERLEGNDGNDILRMRGTSDAQLDGGAGDDKIFGFDGAETILGGDGDDIVRSGRGNDQVDLGAGNDVARLGDDDDQALGGAGSDRIFGNGGADQIDGGDDADRLFGGSGADMLEGGAGNDVLRGGSGGDILHGGAGDDRLFGGSGPLGDGNQDTFVFTALDNGSDRIKDFENGTDLIDLVDFGFADFAAVEAIASNTGAESMKLDFGGGHQVVIEDMRLDQFDVTDVILFDA